MKWIGQDIYDKISRFRSDVYLESISSGTIASGGNLGLDSNNKIVKATVSGGGGVTLAGTPDYITISGQEITRNQIDLTADVTGVLPSANLDSDTAHLSGTQTFTGDKSFSGSTVFTSSSLARPIVNIKNTGNNAQGGSFIFSLDKGAAGADSDIPGVIYWQSDDDAQAQTTFGQIYAQVADATNGQEAGAMYFKVAEYDGTSTTGLKLDGDTNADGEIDVTIGAGASSVTTIAGTLTMGSTAAMTNAGLVSVANQSNITGVGTISSGTWQGTAIASAYLDSDTAHLSGTQTFSGAKTFSATTTTFTSATADSPLVKILNTTDDDQASRLMFEKLRADDGVASGQNLGEIWFTGQDNAQNTEDYAAIISEIDVSTGGQESGKLGLYVASHDGDNNKGFEIVGGSADNEVDVTIGNGTASLTTIAGDLSVTTGLILDSVDVTTIQTSGESFADNDTSLMTSAAIDDRINAAGGGSLSGDNFATDLKIGRDADNLIDFTTDNQITFRASAGDGVVMKASGEIEATELDISGAIAMNSDQKLSFGHASTFIEGATSGSKLMLFGQTDIFLRINNSTVISMDNAKCEFSIPAIPATNDGVALGSATKMWSDVYCAGNIELGHATDTTIARSAAGTVTIEGKEIMTKDKKIHIQQTSFTDDLATTEHFIPFNSTAESANITNVNVPMVMPVAGKLLKIHMKVNQHHNTTSNTVTFKLYDVDDGENWSAANSNVLGTKVIDGTAREDVMIADFTDLTTSGASGTNAFSAGDLIGVTLQNSVDLATTNYLVTMVFELDFSSY